MSVSQSHLSAALNPWRLQLGEPSSPGCGQGRGEESPPPWAVSRGKGGGPCPCVLSLRSQKVVTALDRTWHPEHFFCAQCGAFFGPEGMTGPEGLPVRALRCLRGQWGDLGGLGWLRVSLKHHPLPRPRPLGFHEKDGKAYCRKDYFDMFAPKCGGCARAILENYISALNTLWHPECFVCRVRGISIQPEGPGQAAGEGEGPLL